MTISSRLLGLIPIIATLLLTSPSGSEPQYPDPPLYLDPDAPVADRVEDLLVRMTIEEKIGQMNQINFSLINADDMGIINIDEEKVKNLIRNYHVGSFINGEAVPPQQWFEFIDTLTRVAMEESRLGVPIIYGIDHVHGASYMSETTIFPHAINLGATFEPYHSHNAGWVTALESADVGHHWNFAPTLDLGVNPIWPRLYETYGEDPHMVSAMGRAYIEGYQNNQEIYPYRLASNAKHFIAYSDPVSGWDKTQVQVGMQQIYELHLPPFLAAMDAGLKTVMVNSSEVNGTPVHASFEFLTEMLRNQLGFEGVVLTDWDEVGKLVDFHRTAKNYTEATYMAVTAGIDMSMNPLNLNFYDSLLELYKDGRISEERIDESVRRILRLKFEIGLFENPFPRNDRFDRIGSSENRQKALEAARESMVLLKNTNSLLPLEDPAHIVLAGPSANSRRNLAGGWTLAWQGREEERYPEDMHTIYTALQQEFPDARIDVISDRAETLTPELSERLHAADVIIYAGGEEPYSEFVGNITDLTLPRAQRDEVALLASSGTPVVLLLVQGRPRIITGIIDQVEAFIHAGLPGFEGAEAIANVLSGAVNPSGRLPVSYPKFTGHYLNYNYKPSELYFFHPDNQNHLEEPNPGTMLYSFGDGLSYTTFEYSDLQLSSGKVAEGEHITASVTLTNTGDVGGKEPVLWYLTNVIGRVSRPVRELKHFEKIYLEPGQSETLTFEIRPEQSLWYPDSRGNRVFEEGDFLVRAGELYRRFRFEK
ncbi:MAG: beta-glucosidase [Balneolaceae bacterium]|nr:MAG: beta-glucosidase [Balneolaceae bacterium]